MSRRVFTPAALASVLLAAAGCSGGGVSAEPDAGNAFTCESGEPTGGEAIDLAVGVSSDSDEYVELSDGDDAPVVPGEQGIYMLMVRLRAGFSIPSDEICLQCYAEVSPSASGSYGGVAHPGLVRFRVEQGDTFIGPFIVFLGHREDIDAADLEGAEVDLTMDCDGHGFSGSVARSLRLFVTE